jgi:hypothetical protein
MRIARLAAGLTLVLAACSSDGGTGTEPGPTPAIAIALNPVTATVQQGGSTTTSATLTRSGGFSGTVNLTVTGAPTGVAGSVGAVQTNGGVTTGTVTIQVAAATAPGTYTLTVRGSGSGVSDATATFTLTVTAAGPEPAYTLAVAPTSLSIAQGGSGSAQVAIGRTAFTGAVALTATGAPAGMTTSFAPASATGTSSALTVSVAGSTAPGSYTLTIRGTATGLSERTTTLGLTVTGGSSSGSASFDFSMCAAGQRPIWFAFQNGAVGTWTPITGNNNVYTFDVTEDRGGFAYVTQQAGGAFQTIVYFMTRTEINNATNFCPNPPATKSVTGTLAGMGAQDFASVFLGGGAADVAIGQSAFTISNVADGTHDLVGWRYDLLGTAGTPDRGFLRRDQNIPNGGSVGTVDFGGAESFDAATAPLTVNGAAAGETTVHGMGYYTGAQCTYASLYTALSGTPGGMTLRGVPADRQRATDFHQTFVTGVTGNGTAARTIQEWFHTLGARTVNLPANLDAPLVVAAPSTGYRRLQASFTLPTDYADGVVNFTYNTANGQQIMLLVATHAWVGSNAVILVTPAFSGLAGWMDAWAPPTSASGPWAAQATASNLTTQEICREGGRVISTYRTGTY